MENNFYDMDALNHGNQNDNSGNGDSSGKFWLGALTGFGITAVLMAVIVGCMFIGLKGKKTNESSSIGSQSFDLRKQDSYETGIDEETLRKLQVLEDTIQRRFYLHDVTTEELETGIYKGMLEALDDPYSEYYTPEELTAMLQQTEGFYYGIGAYISLDEAANMPKVSGVIEGTPAEEAGLRTDDIIYEIEGESTYGMTLNQTVSKIKGEENTQVHITVIRDGERLEKDITRKKVESPTVKYEVMDNHIGYIQITEFSEVTVEQFKNALAAVRKESVKGIILDLRGNPGGSLSAVLDIARQLLPKGLVVYTETKDGKREEYSCDGKEELDIPMVVLVDGNSASASEILAGAIQDYGIGTLLGTTTYGKGIVQQIIPLYDNSAIKITISAYYTPNGRNIHKIGIEPDIVCEFDAEAYYDEENPYDNQLEKAKEVLGGMMK